MSEPRTDRTGRTDLPSEAEAAPDMLAELGALACGLFDLSEPRPLTEAGPAEADPGPRVPAQADRSPERAPGSDALLDELGDLDL